MAQAVPAVATMPKYPQVPAEPHLSDEFFATPRSDNSVEEPSASSKQPQPSPAPAAKAPAPKAAPPSKAETTSAVERHLLAQAKAVLIFGAPNRSANQDLAWMVCPMRAESGMD
eukprot:7420821-Karenia_brevis.AAC.1